jgi:hypothetical protein
MTTAPSFALRARTTEEPEPDLTSIVVIHRAIRQDLRRLAACLGQIAASGAPGSRSHAIWRYTAALLAQIRTHHQNEDEILWPVIAATAGQAIDLAPLTDDHQALLLHNADVSLPQEFPPVIPLITLAGVLVLTLIVIRGPLRRATRIRPGTARRYE